MDPNLPSYSLAFDPPNIVYAVMWLASQGLAARVLRSAGWAFIRECLDKWPDAFNILRRMAASPPDAAASFLKEGSTNEQLRALMAALPPDHYKAVVQTLRIILKIGNPCFKRSNNYSIQCPAMRFIPNDRGDGVNVDDIVALFLEGFDPESDAEEGPAEGEDGDVELSGDDASAVTPELDLGIAQPALGLDPDHVPAVPSAAPGGEPLAASSPMI